MPLTSLYSDTSKKLVRKEYCRLIECLALNWTPFSCLTDVLKKHLFQNFLFVLKELKKKRSRAFSESILTYFMQFHFGSGLIMIIVIVGRIDWLFLGRIVFVGSFALCLRLIVIVVIRSLIVVDTRCHRRSRVILIVTAFGLTFLQIRSVRTHTQLWVENESFGACFQVGQAVWAVPKFVAICLMIKVAE